MHFQRAALFLVPFLSCAWLGACLEGADDVPTPPPCMEPDAEGKACDDGNSCTAFDACHGGRCGGFVLPEDSPCDDGNACTEGELCHVGQCVGTRKDCTGLDGLCQEGTCNTDTGECEALLIPEGTPCDDGDLCTLVGECVLGECTEQDVVDCSGLSGQCAAGSCDPRTGACVGAPLVDGITCDDGDACTARDTCAAGACRGIALVDGSRCDDGNACTFDDTCIDGLCFSQPVTNGTPCDDGQSCSARDVCMAGACVGSVDLCLCANSPDDTPCDDLDPCTEQDLCVAGQCSGQPKVCAFVDDACNRGACNPSTGACEARPVLDGTECSDADPCTVDDACVHGDCVGAAKDCSGVEGPCHGSTCDATGACVAVARGDRTACDDEDACTVGEACQAGVCTGGRELCSACVRLALGDPCDDASLCTGDERCVQVGVDLVCLGNQPDCSDMDGSCAVGACDHASGLCVARPAPDGSRCEDGDACTEGDTCDDGECVGPPVRICDAEPTECEPYDDNDDVSVATPVVFDGGATSVIRARISTPGESDWFAVTLGPDSGFTARTRPDCGSSLDTVISVFAPDGVTLLAFDDNGEDATWSQVKDFFTAEAGTFYVQITSYASSGTGAYNLWLEPGGVVRCDLTADCGCGQLRCAEHVCRPAGAVEAEPNEAAGNASVAVLDGEVVGQLGAVDVDVYAIELSQGMPIDVETLAFCGAPAVDTRLTLYGTDGVSVVATNDDQRDSILARVSDFTAAAAGTYYIAVESTNFDSGRYRLAVRDLRCATASDCGCIDQVCDAAPGDRGLCVPAIAETEPNGIGGDPTGVLLGERVQGTIFPAGDYDFFRVRLEPGTYTVATHGYCGSSLDTIVTVRARDTGAIVGQDDDGGEDFFATVRDLHVPVTRWFDLVVTSRGSSVGNYVISVVRQP